MVDPKSDPVEGTLAVLKAGLPEGMWQRGKNRLFLKQDALKHLRYWKYSVNLTKIQTRWRMVTAKTGFNCWRITAYQGCLLLAGLDVCV